MAAVALVSLDPLALFKELREDFVEKFIFIILTGRVGFLDPHQVPCEDVDAQLAEQGGLVLLLVGDAIKFSVPVD